MYALALTLLLLPNAVFANMDDDRENHDLVCFDMEPGEEDGLTTEDGWGEKTNSKVCAWQDGIAKKCVWGVKRYRGEQTGCILLPKTSLDKSKPTYVEIHGYDAMWIDTFILVGNKGTGAWRDWVEVWGRSNDDGWCLSKDRNDWIHWNMDWDHAQHVPHEECFYKFRLNASGSVSGWKSTNQKKKCRKKIKTNCKQGCPRGWQHWKTVDRGCCKSFGNCGGNRKICVSWQHCRRRTGDNPEDGYWVELSDYNKLSSPRAD